MVRLMREEREGRFVRNIVVKMMWEDVDKRSKLLGSVSLSYSFVIYCLTHVQ